MNINSDEIFTGWLSPTGEFIPCSSYEHISTANEIADKLGLEHSYKPDQELMERGWVSISILSFFEHGFMVSYLKEHITNMQKLFLRRFFEEKRENICQSGILSLYDLGVIERDEYQEYKASHGWN